MKKEYQKPQMVVENFMLSDYIAVCKQMVNFSLNSACDTSGWPEELKTFIQFAGDGTFAEGQSCNSITTADEFNSIMKDFGVCYHNPTGTYQIFSS